MNTVATFDLRRQHKALYQPSACGVSIVDVPDMQFLMIDGYGDPNTAVSYRQAIEALYAVAYTLKFAVKKRPGGFDYPMMPLEGLWWTGQAAVPDAQDRSAWQWTVMIMVPDAITPTMAADAVAAVDTTKHPPALPLLRLERFHEGRAAQILYVGPYAGEQAVISRIHAAIRAQGHELSGKHHEIYLSDPRRTPPDKLKTIIRQPFK